MGEMKALLLRALGYKVTLARSGDEVKSAPRQVGRIGCRPRMNGRQPIERLRRQSPIMKSILTSGAHLEPEPISRAAVEEMAETMREGARNLMKAPFLHDLQW